ncbi:MAG: 3-phosphoshikimate 1-carboxyvinyltransferase [Planctomycetales bacterium]|nr:3-phosphoshikimate 1-carboxyvinyltransferase [Planctomycetales bacterium]
MTPCDAVDSTIRPPGSKSITNRALVCAALAEGRSHLSGVLDSEDTQVMIAAWRKLGIDVEQDLAAGEVVLQGCGGRIAHDDIHLDVGNSGTTIRFLTAALAACGGHYVLNGVPRMRERPIGDLLRGLQQLGCTVSSRNAQRPDCPPVEIDSQGMAGGRAEVAGNISSQYLSGLMLAAPLAARDVLLEVSGELVSTPYVDMTSAVMRSFGAEVRGPAAGPLHIPAPMKYQGTRYTIEPDASAASYFWGAAAITGGRARVEGLSRSSLQGDVAFCDVLQKMGCDVLYGDDFIEVQGHALQGLEIDMGHISDTVQTLAAVALFAAGPTIVRGVAHNRVKETDRISDLARELERLGATVEEFPDGLAIHPAARIAAAEIETYHDHRMAMSLALVGLRATGIVILDPACTAKTYPGYWQDLQLFSGSRIERLD